MSSGIPEPTESFFISESLADQVDMAQFGDPESEDVTIANLMADVMFDGGDVIRVTVTSCVTAANDLFCITGAVESPQEVSDLIGRDITSVALIITKDVVLDIDVSDMRRTIEIQAPGGRYYGVMLNFEKKSLIIKG